ncbi:MAG: SAVED domain-containing protein [Myxococcales bacterium]
MAKKGPKPVSPVKKAKARDIPAGTQALLYAAAAGRCEFQGCNKSLIEHHLTLLDGNFAQMAHIYAFNEDGPRGRSRGRPKNINKLSNLMLLCGDCHHQIDTQPALFPVATLREYKREHEDRVRLITGLRHDAKTVVLQLKSKIGGDAVEIPLADVSKAVAPRWPKDRQGIVIDLTTIDDKNASFNQLAADEICKRVTRLYEPGMDVDQVRHISLFALASQPLLMLLGSRLSNKIPVDLYQKHRDSKDWVWKTSGPIVEYDERGLRRGSDPSQVALVLSLSGTVDLGKLPAFVDSSFSIIELTLKGQLPNPDFLRRREDLVEFGRVYRLALARIVRDHPTAKEIHVFPAVPAPVAVLCGYELLKKAQPALVAHDCDKSPAALSEF